MDKYIKNGTWDYKISRPIYRLRGRKLGLVGFGKIPQALAEKVKPLGLHVIAYDPYMPEHIASEKGATLVSLEELCEKSDIISVHAPLTASTKGLIGMKEFALMKSEAILINTSRGPLIDEEALVEALLQKKIGGAALDVVEAEPIQSYNPLLKMENVVLTPHVAWYSEESEAELRAKAAMGVADVLLYGQYPKYLVNKEVKKVIQLGESDPDTRYALLLSN